MFPTPEDCASANTNGSIYCPKHDPICNGSSLVFYECGTAGFGAGAFAIPVGEILTFDFLPY